MMEKTLCFLKNKVFTTGVFLLGCSLNQTYGQSMSNYAFTHATNGSLADMTSGTTSLMTGQQDSDASSIQPIGFDFFFMGVQYTHFSMNSNGQFRLYTSATGTVITANSISDYVGSTNTFAPMGGNNEVGNGAVYKVTGVPGNRRLVIEWRQFWVATTNLTNAGNMQAWLDENTGKVTYIYGEIYNSSTTSSNSRAIFLSSGSTSGSSGYVTVSATPTFVTNTTTAATNSFPGGGTSSGVATNLIPNLGSNANGSRVSYTFTPAPPSAAPSGLTAVTTSISSMTLNWTDNATNERGYFVEYSTDNVNWTATGLLPINANTYNLTGLLANTNYFIRAKAYSEGATLASNVATATTASCAATTGTIMIGATGAYPTLTAALGTLVSDGFGGALVLELQTDYAPASETYPVVLPNLQCSNNTNTVTIRPASNVATPIMLSTASSQTINIDAGSNYTIDGRPGSMGTASMLTIDNTSIGGNDIRFINAADSNTLKYCKMTGVNTGTSNGMIAFSSSAVGNNYNTISNCNITKGATAPANLLYSAGANTNNNILNNNFSDFAADAAFGITLGSGSSNWLINSNSFFQTSSTPSGSVITAINITGVDGFTISNNQIGGSAPGASGSPWTSDAATSSNVSRIIGIKLNVGANAVATNIDNNTITNIALNSSSAGGSNGGAVFIGIFANTGSMNIGANGGNTIGSMSLNDAIVLTTGVTTTGENGGLVGIDIGSAGSVNVTNNMIGGLKGSCAPAGSTFRIKGIYCSGGTAKKTIANNTIGGTVANSISCGTASNTALQDAYGIQYNSSAPAIIENNIIRNITAGFNPAADARAWGIYTLSSGNDTITHNNIYNIMSNATNGPVGIHASSSGMQYVSYNNIYSLVQKGSGGSAIGIYSNATAGTKTIAYNAIQDLRQDMTGATSGLTGINIATSASYNIHNNTINLDYAGSPVNNATNVIGIIMPTTTAAFNNNLIKINALSDGTTKGRSACVVKPSGTPSASNFNANNNIYYINNADSNYIFLLGTFAAPTKAFHTNATGTVSGTNIVYDTNFNSNCSFYKGYIGGLAAGKETASFTENTPLTGGSILPDNMQPNPAGMSYAQNRGIPLGYSFDILNNAVSATTPDIGAVEFSSGTSITTTPPTDITPASVSWNCGDATAVALISNIPVVWTLGDGQLYTDANATMAYSGTAATDIFAKANNNRYIYGSYTVGSCTSSDSAFITVNNATANALANATGALNTDSSVIRNAAANLHNADCELMATLTPSGSTPLGGWLTGKIFMDPSVQNTTTGPYVTRHFELTPNVNAATSNANITLYFTQTEFDAYNTYVINNGNVNVNPLLPSGPSGSTANILVDKFNAASGSPSPSNNNSAITITPTSVTWDAANSWWAVTFPTTGFSGFFLHTNVNPTPLPVNWISTSATLNHQKQAVINWSVSEKETVAYQIQKSADGSNFAKLAAVNSKGNGNNAYSYTEGNILNGKAWYRIAQQGKDGKESYSKIMELQNSALYGQIGIYPNPATQILNIEIQSEAAYGIYDLQGKVVAKGILQAGKNTLNIAALAKGFYTIKIGDYNQKIVLQ